MKSLFVFIFFGFFFLKITSQNLVPNPSFEIYSNCPHQGGQINFADGWFKTTNHSSDYFNSCSSNFSVPVNATGFQYANNGNAYAGIYCFSYNQEAYRDYISIKLKDTLIAKSKYKISFYASLSDTSMYGINCLAAFVSKFNPYININSGVLSSYKPQIISENILLIDSDNWVKIEENYLAIGGEEYISIGNFYKDKETLTIKVNTLTPYEITYYYIDDVSVIKLPDQDIDLDSIFYTATCSDSAFLQLRFQNQGAKALDFTKDTVVFSTEVKLNGAVVKSFDTELNSNNENPVPNTPLAPDSFMSIKIGPVDLSSYGSNYEFTISSFSVRDSNSSNDTLVFDMVPKYQEECFKLIIPNVFTPNGDGVNDTFYFQNAENKKLHTQILNRWGEEVANWSGNHRWDGGQLPNGVYYYVVMEMDNETIVKTLKGKVSILR